MARKKLATSDAKAKRVASRKNRKRVPAAPSADLASSSGATVEAKPLAKELNQQILPAPPEGAVVFKNITGDAGLWVHRSMLKAHPQNPRTITTEARKLLIAEIELHGYVDRICWDVRSSFIVRGHQRLGCMDRIMGTKDYWLPVIVVDKDEQWVLEAVISGNNTVMQGEWDIALLQDIYTKHKVKPESTGFTSRQLNQYFGIQLSPAQQQLAELDKQIADIEKFKQENAAALAEELDVNNVEYFAVIYLDDLSPPAKALMVFESQAERKRFTDFLSLPDGRYHELKVLGGLRCVKLQEDDASWLDAGESADPAPAPATPEESPA